MKTPEPPEEGEIVFCRYFTHYRTGKRIYPKNGEFFAFRPRGRGRRKSSSQQLELPLEDKQKEVKL